MLVKGMSLNSAISCGVSDDSDTTSKYIGPSRVHKNETIDEVDDSETDQTSEESEKKKSTEDKSDLSLIDQFKEFEE